MNREIIVANITELFAGLECYLKLKGRQNLNDIAVLAVDFCKELLNRIYEYHHITLNTMDPNSVATDLIDTASREGLQTTANTTTEKIRDVRRKASTHDIAAHIDHIAIVFLVAKAPPEPESSGNFTPTVGPPSFLGSSPATSPATTPPFSFS